MGTAVVPSEYTGWSTEASFTTASDNIAPAAPTLAVTAGDQEIAIVMVKPTLDVGGGANNDFSYFNVYYKLSAGVTTSDLSISTSSTHHSFPASAKTYFKATAVDIWGNESALSTEESETPTSAPYVVDIDDIVNVSNILVGDRMIGIILSTPPTDWIGFSHWEIEYDEQSSPYVVGSASFQPLTTDSKIAFIHKNLDITKLYAYRARAVGDDGSFNSWTVDNNAGVGYSPTETDNTNLTDETILAQNIVAVNEVRGNSIYAGSHIEIGSGGYIHSGQSAYDTGTGWFLGDDSGTIKLSIGNASGNKLLWTGTEIQITGKLTATSGQVYDDILDAFSDAADALAAAEDAQAAADGQIVGFYQDTAPATIDSNYGDIWIDTNKTDPLNSTCIYRYQDSSGGYTEGAMSWVQASDNAIGLAYLSAYDAQATADGKIVTFYQDNAPTSEGVGDLWIDTNDDNKLYRSSQANSSSHWVLVRDGGIAEALADAANALAATDGQIVGFYQDAAPAVGMQYGDIWIDTNFADPIDETCIRRYQDSSGGYTDGAMSWVAEPDNAIGLAYLAAYDAQATADGKITTFYQTGEPSAGESSIGDFWVDINDSYKTYVYSGSAWVASSSVDALDALSDAADALSAASDALSIADGEIIGFYQETQPAAIDSSFGDIWIDTTSPPPTTTDIHRYQDTSGGSSGTLGWREASDNAIGLAYLAAYDAQSTADGKIVTFYQDGGAGSSIDVGPGATDRTGSQATVNYTYINVENPVNITGTLDTVEVWANSNLSGVKVGTFYGSGTSYRCRDFETIGSVTSGSKQTFSSLNITAQTGDFLGIFWTSGSLEYGAGSDGVYYDAGDQTGGGITTYTLLATAALSVYATGTSASGGPPTSEGIGDLWVDTGDYNKMYRAAIAGANEITAGEWEIARNEEAIAYWGHSSDITTIDGGNIYAGSTIVIGSSGHIRSGQTDYDTGSGWWLGDVSGTAKFSIGNSSGNKLLWTGSALQITGVITADTGYIGGTGGWVIAAGKMTASGIGLATAAGDATYAFWAGNDTSASAEFRVTHAGKLYAAGAVINGTLQTAVSGTRLLLTPTLGGYSHSLQIYVSTTLNCVLQYNALTFFQDAGLIVSGSANDLLISGGRHVQITAVVGDVSINADDDIDIFSGQNITLRPSSTAYNIFLENLPTTDPHDAGALYAPTSYVRISTG